MIITDAEYRCNDWVAKKQKLMNVMSVLFPANKELLYSSPWHCMPVCNNILSVESFVNWIFIVLLIQATKFMQLKFLLEISIRGEILVFIFLRKKWWILSFIGQKDVKFLLTYECWVFLILDWRFSILWTDVPCIDHNKYS